MLWRLGKPELHACYVLRDLSQGLLGSLFLGGRYRFVDSKGHSGFGFGNKLTVGAG